MDGRGRHLVIGMTALALIATVAEGGAQLRLGLENRADLNPRQIAVGVKVAGMALGIAISWSRGVESRRSS